MKSGSVEEIFVLIVWSFGNNKKISTVNVSLGCSAVIGLVEVARVGGRKTRATMCSNMVVFDCFDCVELR